MPPKTRYTKQQIVEAAISVVRQSGHETLNARSVAKKLGCSTQPVLRQFGSMAELKAAVIRQAGKVYSSYIQASKSRTDISPYKAAGMALIRFAREDKNLFKLFFMRDRRGENISENIDDENLDYVLQSIMEQTGYTRQQAYDFHLQMWIFIHGLAVLIATNYINLSDEQTSALLTQQYTSMTGRFAE